MRKKFAVATALGLSLVMLLAGCGSKEKKEDAEATSSINPTKYITLGEYKGIEVEAPVITVSDEEVQESIDAFLLEHATDEEITDRPVQDGDVVIIDFTGYKDDVAFEGGSAEDFRLEIGSGSFIDGFEDGIIGANTGDKLDLNLTFPAEYPSEELAGQPAVFKVTVKKILKVVPAELTDQFVVDNTDYETVDSYKEGLKKELEEEKAANAKTEFNNSVWQKVLDNVTVKEYPEDMVNEYKENFKNYYETTASYYGSTLEEFVQATGTTMEDFEKMLVEMSQNSVKEELTFEAIIKAEKISLTEEEFDQKYEEMAKEFEYESVADFVAAYGDEMIRQNILWQEALDFIVENAVEI